MGINFAYARKKFSEAQQKLRKEYKAAGMTDEQILEMYEYDLHQFNRDLAYQRHTQRLGILEEPDMEEEGYNPLLHKFIDALTVYQQPTGAAKLWWLDEIEDADLIKSLMRLTDDELDLIDMLAFGGCSQSLQIKSQAPNGTCCKEIWQKVGRKKCSTNKPPQSAGLKREKRK